MRYNSERAAVFLKHATDILANDEPQGDRLERLWGTLGGLHACVLAKDLLQLVGNKVYSGPFQGMALTQEAMIGPFAPHLLGCYEHELHGVVAEFIQRAYPRILNIGCSFGYYAVGLARAMPDTQVLAFDIDEAARRKCAQMAVANGVKDRVVVSGEFHPEDFSRYIDLPTLVVMDVEGAEVNLLDPEKYPALRLMDVVVEIHDLFNPQLSKILLERFSPTHDVQFIMNKPQMFDLTQVLGKDRYIDPFDAMLVTWETRAGPTPWGVFRVKGQ